MGRQVGRCGGCLFFVRPDGEIGQPGTCFRFPPRPFPVPGGMSVSGPQIMNMSMRPIVQQTDWCGEWQEKE